MNLAWTTGTARLPSARAMSWPRDAGLRIDHLLLSKKAARRLVTASVDRSVRGIDNASDHAPVWIELKDGAGN